MNYYDMNTQEVLSQLDTSMNGLTGGEAESRLSRYGKNEITEQKKKGVLRVFAEQFADLLVINLIVSALVSVFTDNIESAIVIICVITMNAVLGTVQHFKAEKSLEALKSMSSPTAKVMRDNNIHIVNASDVTVGDIVLVEQGDIVCADGRLVSCASLQVNESSLTGESNGIDKFTEMLTGEKIPLGDRKNMVYTGSLVTAGRGMFVVTAVGMDTELGKIAGLINKAERKKTPLQHSLDKFSKQLSVAIPVLCLIVMILYIIRGTPVLDSLMFAVALAVAAIPEALSSIVTIALAIGTRKMAEQNAVIKDLKAVEGLGCVSVICSDKTGTLTQNKMTVRQVYLNGKEQNAKYYIHVLEEKSQRLKQLTEDLVETSKITSGNVKLNMQKLDLVELLYQTGGEFNERFESRNLTIVTKIPSEQIFIYADGRQLYRSIENLYTNAAKYALENTRVYVELEKADTKAVFTIKNVSKNELDIVSNGNVDLTERFVRGERSRTTEGSGLGLSIAKNLTHLMGGKFEIKVDGDLFIATITYNII